MALRKETEDMTIGDRLPMSVLHMWRSPSMKAGGGGVMMRRLHAGLLSAGVRSSMMCEDPAGVAEAVAIPQWPRFENFLRRFTIRLGLNDIHRLSSWKAIKDEILQQADVVHIHGTHTGFFNYLALPALSRAKPVILTLHDMWPMTGHCGAAYDCDRWQYGCGSCPDLTIHPTVRRDATAIEWRLKRTVYRRSHIHVVAPSTWMADAARKSLLARFPIHQIPNGIDTELFRPYPRAAARARFNLKDDQFVLMFAATNVGNPGKGWPLFRAAVRQLPRRARSSIAVLVVGAGADRVSRDLGVPVRCTGPLEPRDLARAFSAADLFVSPTRAEAFGNVLIESVACGTPAVASEVGGVPDVVRPGETGLLVKPGSPQPVVEAIVTLWDDRERLRAMASRCRQMAVSGFSEEIFVDRHIALYRDVIGQSRHRTGRAGDVRHPTDLHSRRPWEAASRIGAS